MTSIHTEDIYDQKHSSRDCPVFWTVYPRQYHLSNASGIFWSRRHLIWGRFGFHIPCWSLKRNGTEGDAIVIQSWLQSMFGGSWHLFWVVWRYQLPMYSGIVAVGIKKKHRDGVNRSEIKTSWLGKIGMKGNNFCIRQKWVERRVCKITRNNCQSPLQNTH